MIEHSEPYYTTSPFGSKQMWLPSGLLSHAQRNEVKKLVEADASLRPAWFFTGTYWKKYGARKRLSVARTAWDNAMVCLASKTSQHLVSVAAWGPTASGDYHMHGVVLGERGKLKRITQRKLKKAWRAGISDMRLYDATLGGIPYALGHEAIAYETHTYCPKGGCDRCEKFQRDYVSEVLRASATSTSDAASSFGGADPLQASYRRKAELLRARGRAQAQRLLELKLEGLSVKDRVAKIEREREEYRFDKHK